MIYILIPLAFIALILFHNFYWKRRNLPPGPTPLPVLGNTLSFAQKPPGYAAFKEWTEKYGPVFTCWMGMNPVVVVTDYQVLKETFIKDADAYAGRVFYVDLWNTLTQPKGHDYGILRTEGQNWRETRRFALHNLRNVGVGKRHLETKILEIVHYMMDRIEEEKSRGIDLHFMETHLELCIGSIINYVLFGYYFDDEEKIDEFHDLRQWMTHDFVGTLATVPGQLIGTTPWLRHLPYFSASFEKIDQAITGLYKFIERNIQKKIAKRKSANGNELDDGEKDFMDIFLDRIEADEKTGEKDSIFTMDNLIGLGFDLFVAGQETSTNTVDFVFLYLVLDQRVQRKMCAEIDQLMLTKHSPDEDITTADRIKLPYLQAVINETQRLCNVLPINLSHKTMRSVDIGGFTLPKGTAIIPQISSVLYDEKIFPEPDKFVPERFIDENGQLKKCEELVPFSLGKRQCSGEPLAKIEMYLLIANFFKKYEVLPEDSMKPPTVVKRAGMTVLPTPYNCRILQRQSTQGQL